MEAFATNMGSSSIWVVLIIKTNIKRINYITIFNVISCITSNFNVKIEQWMYTMYTMTKWVFKRSNSVTKSTSHEIGKLSSKRTQTILSNKNFMTILILSFNKLTNSCWRHLLQDFHHLVSGQSVLTEEIRFSIRCLSECHEDIRHFIHFLRASYVRQHCLLWNINIPKVANKPSAMCEQKYIALKGCVDHNWDFDLHLKPHWFLIYLYIFDN